MQLHSRAEASASPPAAQLDQLRLAQACRSLWLATLSLMAAFMHNGAPAHRQQLARRIARNLDTLAAQRDIFPAADCARFAQLGAHWHRRAAHCAPQAGAPRGRGLLQALARLAPLPR
jgi:hypothetical protein